MIPIRENTNTQSHRLVAEPSMFVERFRSVLLLQIRKYNSEKVSNPGKGPESGWDKLACDVHGGNFFFVFLCLVEYSVLSAESWDVKLHEIQCEFIIIIIIENPTTTAWKYVSRRARLHFTFGPMVYRMVLVHSFASSHLSIVFEFINKILSAPEWQQRRIFYDCYFVGYFFV